MRIPQLAWNAEEPRLPQTHKCMKHRDGKLNIKRNIEGKKSDRKKKERNRYFLF